MMVGHRMFRSRRSFCMSHFNASMRELADHHHGRLQPYCDSRGGLHTRLLEVHNNSSEDILYKVYLNNCWVSEELLLLEN